MRYNFVLLIITFIISCKQPDSKKQQDEQVKDVKDSVIHRPATQENVIRFSAKDTVLFQLSDKILAFLKIKDFTGLASQVHPVLGVRFSPYAFVDTVAHQHLLPTQLIKISEQKKTLVWGAHDGSGEAIKQNILKYFDEFVYDADFLNAPQKAVNKILASGNSLNNLKTIYPNADFTEFYFPGFDPKYGGMDWKTLRLVFQTANNKPWLIAIIHDEWTI